MPTQNKQGGDDDGISLYDDPAYPQSARGFCGFQNPPPDSPEALWSTLMSSICDSVEWGIAHINRHLVFLNFYQHWSCFNHPLPNTTLLQNLSAAWQHATTKIKIITHCVQSVQTTRPIILHLGSPYPTKTKFDLWWCFLLASLELDSGVNKIDDMNTSWALETAIVCCHGGICCERPFQSMQFRKSQLKFSLAGELKAINSAILCFICRPLMGCLKEKRISGKVRRQAQIVCARFPSYNALSISNFKFLVCQHDIHPVGPQIGQALTPFWQASTSNEIVTFLSENYHHPWVSFHPVHPLNQGQSNELHCNAVIPEQPHHKCNLHCRCPPMTWWLFVNERGDHWKCRARPQMISSICSLSKTTSIEH